MRRIEKARLNLLPLTLVAGLLAVPIVVLAQTDSRPGTPLGNSVAPPAAAPAAPAPAASAPAMRPGMMTPAPGAATAPAMPPHAMPPGMMAPAVTAAPAGTFATMPGTVVHERARMSQIIGARVYNDQNENVGTVDDILLRGTASVSGTGAPMAVLQVGGFLGIGARLVAVPLNDLRWNAQREQVVLMGATREALQNRPVFNYSVLTRG